MKYIIIVIILQLTLISCGQEKGINYKNAGKYFNEVKAICDKDDSKMWGVNLNGPIMFVDRHSRDIVTNENDSLGSLTPKGEIFIGKYPESLPIANTSVRWKGKKWTMVIWQSLNKDSKKRNHLIMHEIWHRIQDNIGFPACPSKNSHLAELNGRLLLKMEWLALNAYIQSGFKNSSDLKNAIKFRKHRHSIFPDSQQREASFEMHEGLAEYTGVVMAGYTKSEIASLLNDKIIQNLDNINLLMSFAYTSGALYGYILDQLDNQWKEVVTKSDDFSKLIEKLMKWSVKTDKSEIKNLYTIYDQHQLVAKERKSEKIRVKFLEECKVRFIKSNKLVIPMKIARISFNPFGVVPFGEEGTVYKTLNCFGEWGKLSTSEGGLITSDWSNVIVDAPVKTGNKYTSDKWTLELNKGWKIVKKDDGDFTIEKGK